MMKPWHGFFLTGRGVPDQRGISWPFGSVADCLYGEMLKVMEEQISNVELIPLHLMGLGLAHVLGAHTAAAISRTPLPTGVKKVLVGHSAGGAEAYKYALKHPSEVEACVLWGAPEVDSEFDPLAHPGPLPEIYMVSASGDRFVSCLSAHTIPRGYPPELVHHFCMTPDLLHRCRHANTKLILTGSQSWDFHMWMTRHPAALELMDQILEGLLLRPLAA